MLPGHSLSVLICFEKKGKKKKKKRANDLNFQITVLHSKLVLLGEKEVVIWLEHIVVVV
jgi:hypothetical protein